MSTVERRLPVCDDCLFLVLELLEEPATYVSMFLPFKRDKGMQTSSDIFMSQAGIHSCGGLEGVAGRTG